jgi:hypothetical protein
MCKINTSLQCVRVCVGCMIVMLVGEDVVVFSFLLFIDNFHSSSKSPKYLQRLFFWLLFISCGLQQQHSNHIVHHERTE